MRVTFVTPHAGMSGGIRVIADHARGLVQRGHEVTVISEPIRPMGWWESLKLHFRGQPKSTGNPVQQSHLDGLGLNHRVLTHNGPISDAELPDSDVMVVTWFSRAEAIAHVAQSKGVKVYLLQHDDRCIVGPSFAHLHDRIVKTWQLPMRRIAVSKWIANRVEAEAKGDPVRVVINGVDHQIFRAGPRSQTGQLTIGMYFNRTGFKACGVAVEAYRRARDKWGKQVNLTAMGLEERPNEPEFPVEASYVQNPSREKIAEFYRACDVWLFTSREEGYGLPILEAMACGTPVIATNTGAAEELCSGGGGMLVDVDDLDGLVECIGRFASMTAVEWQTMSKAALATAAENDLEAATDRFERELMRVVEERAVGGLKLKA